MLKKVQRRIIKNNHRLLPQLNKVLREEKVRLGLLVKPEAHRYNRYFKLDCEGPLEQPGSLPPIKIDANRPPLRSLSLDVQK